MSCTCLYFPAAELLYHTLLGNYFLFFCWGYKSELASVYGDIQRWYACESVIHFSTNSTNSVLSVTITVAVWHSSNIGRVSDIIIGLSLCYFCFRWKTVSLVQASMQHLMHYVTVSLHKSKITLQNNCINNTSITQPTLFFYLWLKM